MEVIVIEKNTFREINKELEELTQQVKSVVDTYSSLCKGEKWLDSQEVCLFLNISKRALHNYKEKGLMPYTYINRKNYYKRSDIENFLINNINQADGLTD